MSTPYLGEIRMFAFGRTPRDWLPCDGRLVSIAENDALFVLLGTTYGGDGVVTFGMPDLRGQLPLHWGAGPSLTTRVIGEAGGTENVTLTTAQMPGHNHTLQATSAAANSTAPSPTGQFGAIVNDTMYATDITGSPVFAMGSSTVSGAGNNQPHDNLMPTLTVQFCIATAGIFPSQS